MLVSNFCSAMIYNEDIQICPSCLEPCEFEIEEPVYQFEKVAEVIETLTNKMKVNE